MKTLSAELTALKREPETMWLRDVNAQLLQQALRDLKRAHDDFFARRSRYPRFKSRKHDQGRFRLPQRVRVDGRRLYVPKIGHIRLSESVVVDGSLKSVTFKEAPTGHWFAALRVEFELPDVSPPPPTESGTVGIDVGLKELLVLSNGERVQNPRWSRVQERKLARAQRHLARKQKGSNNRAKARRKVARVHEQTRNRRNDFIHKLTTRLVHEHETLVIEDLNLKGMARTKLSRSVSDAALGEVRRQLEYKALWSHRGLLMVDRWFPSSRLCAACGSVNQSLGLSDRRWECVTCGTEHDRDLNAACNIKAEGLRMYKENVAVGYTETLNACGGRVRRPVGAVAETRHP